VVVDLALIVSMVAFSFVLAVSPGPNNTMVLTISSHTGARSSLPYLVGMATGLFVMTVGVALGLGAVFQSYPLVYQVLKYVGFAYVLYMAWGILRAGAPAAGDQAGVPRSTVQALLFQLVNPKAWIVIAAFTTAYLPAERGLGVTVLGAVIFVAATMPGAAIWVGLGQAVSKLLTSPGKRRLFTTTMAVALVASMIPVLFLG
jgi:threonine/homoserine/homoserine lactone efflux protein